MTSNKKAPNPVDIHVGRRIRLRRLLVSMTQEALAERLLLTFQQVQKYEKGTNRVSASRLFQIANVLGCPVQFFFEEMPSDLYHPGDVSTADETNNFIHSAEGIALNRLFPCIEDPGVRSQILGLVKSIATIEDEISTFPGVTASEQ